MNVVDQMRRLGYTVKVDGASLALTFAGATAHNPLTKPSTAAAARVELVIGGHRESSSRSTPAKWKAVSRCRWPF